MTLKINTVPNRNIEQGSKAHKKLCPCIVSS